MEIAALPFLTVVLPGATLGVHVPHQQLFTSHPSARGALGWYPVPALEPLFSSKRGLLGLFFLHTPLSSHTHSPWDLLLPLVFPVINKPLPWECLIFI